MTVNGTEVSEAMKEKLMTANKLCLTTSLIGTVILTAGCTATLITGIAIISFSLLGNGYYIQRHWRPEVTAEQMPVNFEDITDSGFEGLEPTDFDHGVWPDIVQRAGERS
jgi:hypothetical protein